MSTETVVMAKQLAPGDLMFYGGVWTKVAMRSNPYLLGTVDYVMLKLIQSPGSEPFCVRLIAFENFKIKESE